MSVRLPHLRPILDTRREWLRERRHHRWCSVCQGIQGTGSVPRDAIPVFDRDAPDRSGTHWQDPRACIHTSTQPVTQTHSRSPLTPLSRILSTTSPPSQQVSTSDQTSSSGCPKRPPAATLETPPLLRRQTFLRVRHSNRCLRGPPSRSLRIVWQYWRYRCTSKHPSQAPCPVVSTLLG